MRIKRKIKLSIKYIFSGLNLIEGKRYLKPRKNIICGKKNYFFKGKLFFRDTGEVHIGNYCELGHNLRFITTTHNMNLPLLQTRLYWDFFDGDYPNPNRNKRPIKVGSDVWFGDNVIILPEVNIGDGAIIGAGSIVTKNVPPYSIVMGTPAKVIRYRFKKDMINFLINLKWWDWDNKKIKNNKQFFLTDLRNINRIDDLKEIIK